MEGFRRIRPQEYGCQEKLAGKLAHTPAQRLRMGPLSELPPFFPYETAASAPVGLSAGATS